MTKKQKPQHYGINETSCGVEIDWALKTFVEMVHDGDDVPEHMLRFIADGVKRYLKYEQPWSRAISPEFSNQNAIGLMLAIEERMGWGAKTEIAAHWGCTVPRISQMLKKPKYDPRGMLWQRYQFHKNSYLKMFEKKTCADMLYELSLMKQKPKS